MGGSVEHGLRGASCVLCALVCLVAFPGCYLSHRLDEEPPVDNVDCGAVPPPSVASADTLLAIVDDVLFELAETEPPRRVTAVPEASLVIGSPDGRYAALDSLGRGASLVDLQTGRLHRLQETVAFVPACTDPRSVLGVEFRPDGRSVAVTCVVPEAGSLAVRTSMQTLVVGLPSLGVSVIDGPDCTAGFFTNTCELFRIHATCPTDWRTPLAMRGVSWSLYEPSTGDVFDLSGLEDDEVPIGRAEDGSLVLHGTSPNGHLRLLGTDGRGRDLLRWESSDGSSASVVPGGYVVVRSNGADVVVERGGFEAGSEPRRLEIECSSRLSSVRGRWTSPDGTRALLPCDGGAGLRLFDLDVMREIGVLPTGADGGTITVHWNTSSQLVLVSHGIGADYEGRIFRRGGDLVERPASLELLSGPATSVAWRVDPRRRLE